MKQPAILLPQFTESTLRILRIYHYGISLEQAKTENTALAQMFMLNHRQPKQVLHDRIENVEIYLRSLKQELINY